MKLELKIRPIDDGVEHPLSYFMDDLKEFFENYGWKMTWNSYEDEDEE